MLEVTSRVAVRLMFKTSPLLCSAAQTPDLYIRSRMTVVLHVKNYYHYYFLYDRFNFKMSEKIWKNSHQEGDVVIFVLFLQYQAAKSSKSF